MRFSQIIAVAYLIFCLPFVAIAADFEISGYELVSQTRISRTTFDYNYRAILKNNSSTELTSAKATLSSLTTSVIVIDKEVTFPGTAINTASKSADTFTIRTDRAVQFNQSNLPWKIETTIGPVSTPTAVRDAFANALISGNSAIARLYISEAFKPKYDDIISRFTASQLIDLAKSVKDSTSGFSSDKLVEYRSYILYQDNTYHEGKFQMIKTESGWKLMNL